MQMINLRIAKILSVVGLIIALVVVASGSQSQAMLPNVEAQDQATEEQASPEDKATATITITWTIMPAPSITEEKCSKL